MNSDDHNDIIEGPPVTPDNSSGRAAWDDRGNSVWEWRTAPGIYSRDVDTQRVKALQTADLKILESQTHASTADESGTDFPSRAGLNLPTRGTSRPTGKPKRNGLLNVLQRLR